MDKVQVLYRNLNAQPHILLLPKNQLTLFSHDTGNDKRTESFYHKQRMLIFREYPKGTPYKKGVKVRLISL